MTQTHYTLNGYTMTSDQVFQLAITEQQRAEAAEARAAELEKYLDLANAHALRLMQERDDLRRESDKFADSLNLECAKVIDLCRQLEQAQRKIDAYDKADRALNQALNEGDGVYRP